MGAARRLGAGGARGRVLALRPFVSLAVLVVAVVAGLAALGVVRLVADRRRPRSDAAGTPVVARRRRVPAAAAVVVLPGRVRRSRCWPRVVGVALVVDGVLDALAARQARGTGRANAALSGATSVVLGVLALAWPDVTVLVVAVLVGVRVLVTGIRGVAAALRGTWQRGPSRRDHRARPGRGRLVVNVAALVATLALAAAGVALDGGTARPDDFYAAPADAPDAPGRLLRSEPFSQRRDPSRRLRVAHPLHDDARRRHADGRVGPGRRAGHGDRSTPASPPTSSRGRTARRASRPAAHRPCCPTASPPARCSSRTTCSRRVGRSSRPTTRASARPGPHAYLVGEPAAHDVLDAVRAAQQLDDVALSDRNVVWGHSQGGGAALWTGIVAPDYAPDVDVLGVAALAPASNPSALLAHLPDVSVGALFAAYLAEGYAATYPDVRFADVVRPGARTVVREMAHRCLADRGVVVSALTALLLDQPVWAHADPFTGAFGDRLTQNVPSGPIAAPLLVAQGTADSVVVASSQDEYVAARCAAGYAVDHRTYDGLDHVALVEAGSPLVPDLLAWTRDRLAGAPGTDSCP